jgi:glycosyltransferase involved in cell wall biosynthesis
VQSVDLKVVHIVEGLDRGAVENWLVRMLRHAVSTGVKLDWSFYCQLQTPGCLEEEVRGLGAKVIHSPVPIGQKRAFITALRREIRRGKYDVVHCHHDIVSALYLVAAFGLPVRKRIVHVHNADEAVLTPSPLKQVILREPMRRTSLRLADRIVGISNHTLDTFLGGRQRREGRDIVHYYGIEPQPFLSATADKGNFRKALGLLDDSLILLFAGRLVPEKNPRFVLDVLNDLRKLEPRTVAVFVGSGSEEERLKRAAAELELTENTRFLGWRSDIPEIMTCCDWFILPRPEVPMEGFGIAVVEAQLAGLRLLLSKGIPDDPLLPGSCSKRLSLSEPPRVWAHAAWDQLNEHPPTREHAAIVLAKSPLDMDRALSDLLRIYDV